MNYYFQILARHLETSSWISHGLKSARITVYISWCIGLGVTILHDSMDFGTTGSVVKDVAIIMVVVPTCVMNMYIWVTLRALRHENDALYKAAITALFLFLNFFLCYAYFTSCYVFYIYTVVTGSYDYRKALIVLVTCSYRNYLIFFFGYVPTYEGQ